MSNIDSTAMLFECLGGPAAVGRALGISTEHAASLRRRGRIPPRYWDGVLAALDEKGVPFTAVDLTRIYNAAHEPAA